MIPWVALLVASALHFVDVGREAGLDVVTYCGGADKNHILESTGTGVLVLDYDRDGLIDLYFINAHRFLPSAERETHTSVLYRNRGDGTFIDVTHAAGVATELFGQGGAVGDVDRDGLPDIYVTAFGANRLFRNNGDGTFSDWSTRARVDHEAWSLGASFFDADGDGDHDLIVGSYLTASWDDVEGARRSRKWRGKVEVLDGPKGLSLASNVFYRNRGDGTFDDETTAAGFEAGGEYFAMGIATFDADRDGDIDVYIANDSTPNTLYRNRGDGTFDEQGVVSGAALSADGNTQGSMGVHVGDIDRDGRFEIAVTNFAHDYYTLYHPVTDGLYVDASFEHGIATATFRPLGWGTLFVDVDHDADLDLFFANGHIYPQVDADASLGESYLQPNQLFLYEDGRYVDAGEAAGPGLAIAASSTPSTCTPSSSVYFSRKRCTSSGMSSRRSRSGGSWIWMTFSR